ncbi:uncharacterized protein TNCV_3653351 [Trichonephila clavipes]|nr:uncharacterized protein TNCV_3653351 [Trichonephila clavipes]
MYLADESKDVQLSYEDDLRRTILSSIDSVTAEIRERFQQLQNLAQKYAFFKSEVILSMDELILNQAPQDINEEFQLGAYVYKILHSCNRAWLLSDSCGCNSRGVMAANFSHCFCRPVGSISVTAKNPPCRRANTL